MAQLDEVLDALARGRMSARDYVDRLLTRIDKREPLVHAFTALDAVRARLAAAACDERRVAAARRGTALGALHGLPVGVKDIFDTADLCTEYGSSAYAGNRPIHDAELVSRLKQAGAFVLAKTVTTEFAFRHPGATRNPWNIQHTPGGSSSGSAAAVSAGLVHAAIGTQTNGSVIRPAAFCGVVGYKPSLDTLPFGGALHFSPTLDQPGTFTRTVADVARFTSALTQSDAVPAQVAALTSPPRLGVITNFPWTALEPEAHAHWTATVARLNDAGAITTALNFTPPFHDAHRIHETIMFHEGAKQLAGRQREHRARLSRKLNDAIDAGRRISAGSYGEALARRAVLIDLAADFVDDFDAVISPPAPSYAPARLDTTGNAGFCTLWSLVGFPALTVPSGLATTGVPFGIQIAANAGNDAGLLSVASWIEHVLGSLHSTVSSSNRSDCA